MDNKNLVKIVFALIIGGLIGGFIGMNYSYSKGIEDSRAKLEKLGILQPVIKESLSVFGKVLSSDGKTISLEVVSSYDPLATPGSPETKTVLTTPTTEVILRKFEEATKPGLVPYSDTKIELSALAVGDQVVVESDKNVIGVKEVTAVKIIVTK